VQNVADCGNAVQPGRNLNKSAGPPSSPRNGVAGERPSCIWEAVNTAAFIGTCLFSENAKGHGTMGSDADVLTDAARPTRRPSLVRGSVQFGDVFALQCFGVVTARPLRLGI
jgi:hypothetical protein